MTKCPDCKKDMLKTTSCTYPYLVDEKGMYYKRQTFSQRYKMLDEGKICHDCGIIMKEGNIHHYGCDWERCPKCHGQLISCGCEMKPVKRMVCKRDGTEKCYSPENNKPNGMCVLWGCKQAGAHVDLKTMKVVKNKEA